MKPKTLYLVIMPLLWLAAASLSTYHQLGDRLTLFAFVPSLWLLLFIDANSIAFPQALLAGTPAIAVAGLILLKLKLPPRAAIIFALFLTLIIWGTLLIAGQEGRAIHVRGATVIWFFICFSFSLCLLPAIAFLGYIGRGLINKIRRQSYIL